MFVFDFFFCGSPYIIGVRDKSRKGPFSSKELSLCHYFRCVVSFLSNLSSVCLSVCVWLTDRRSVCLSVCPSFLCLCPLVSQSVCVSTYLSVTCVRLIYLCVWLPFCKNWGSLSVIIDIVSLSTVIDHFFFISVLRWLRVSVNDRQYSGLLSRFLRRKLSWSQIRTEWVQWNFSAFALLFLSWPLCWHSLLLLVLKVVTCWSYLIGCQLCGSTWMKSWKISAMPTPP